MGAVEREVFAGGAFTRDQMAYMLRSASAVTFLAMSPGEPAGMVSLWWRRGASTCRIVNLAVRRRFRRRGLGRVLVDAAVRFGRRHGFAGVTLEVAERNSRARALYAACGFVIDRRLRDYYEPGQHALRLVRWLPGG